MRDEKQLLLDEIKEKIQGAKGFLIARYEGLTAQKAREFRNLVAQSSGDFEIVRKRVFSKAAEAVGITLDVDQYKGHLGVIFANEDPAKMTKQTYKYSEDSEKSFVILGGYIEGQLCSADDIEAIAKLPSLDELRAEFLGVLEAPLSHTVGVVDAILTSVLHCMEEKAKKSQD